jgi:hypothetical protein
MPLLAPVTSVSSGAADIAGGGTPSAYCLSVAKSAHAAIAACTAATRHIAGAARY